MSQQVWKAGKAQDLKPGDLIPGQTTNLVFALEVKEVSIEGEMVVVYCYKDVYRMLPPHLFHMKKNQHVPVAVSGVTHMEKITNFEIAE